MRRIRLTREQRIEDAIWAREAGLRIVARAERDLQRMGASPIINHREENDVSSLNKWTGIGNLGSDPEISRTPSGTKYGKFSIATNRKWKENGQLKEDVQWHRITVWFDNLVNVVEQHLNKGDRVYVEGRIEYNEWQNREGVRIREAGIVCTLLILLGGKSQGRDSERPPHGQPSGGGGYRPAAAQPAPAQAPAQPASPAPAQPAQAPAKESPEIPENDDYDDLPF